MDNPRPQLAAAVAACDTAAVSHAAKLASIPGIPESVPATVFLAYGGSLVVTSEKGACVASGGVKSDVLEKSLAATSVRDRERHMTERTVI